ncbi:hypothetical protein FTO91_14085 [Listeria monocytogenes]|nr:hypothetical protein [Listeria monocytogenes]
MTKKDLRKQKKKTKKERIKQLPLKRKIGRYLLLTPVCFVSVIFVLATVGTVAHATGLVDETINTGNEYSKYALTNYQLDFYVDNSWGWLPWNWGEGIGKSVMYGLYAITNFIWTISLYLSNATGYLVQEAYQLDFISQTSTSIGKNMQTIAGVNQTGFTTSGFYIGFLLIFVLILGIYVVYTGLIKRETTKAIRAILNFVVVFLLSASFIAYSPDYISKINDFSKDISNTSLDVGTKITMPNSDTQGKDSVDMIRDSLFSIQVKQPWLLLQFGTTDVELLGEDRVEGLLSTSPDLNNGEDREKIVKAEIEDEKNTHLTLTKTINRLGTVFFLFFFNIGISVFVFLLTGIMIFSQVLFIIFAMFLPISFLLSMIPSFEGMGKRAIMKLFNVIMTRAGITLIITVAFSISSMLYSLAGNSPFFMIMFLQIVTFAGIYFKLGDLMSLFSLQSSDSQQVGSRIFRKPRMLMNRQARRLQRTMQKGFGGGHKKSAKSSPAGKSSTITKANHERSNASTSTKTQSERIKKQTLGKCLGEKTGQVLDTKNRVLAKANDIKVQVKDSPTNTKYALHKGNRNLIKQSSDFIGAVKDTRMNRQAERESNQSNRRKNIAQKRQEMEQARRKKQEPLSPSINKAEKSTMNERPLTPKQRPHQTIEERKQQMRRPKPTQQVKKKSDTVPKNQRS